MLPIGTGLFLTVSPDKLSEVLNFTVQLGYGAGIQRGYIVGPDGLKFTEYVVMTPGVSGTAYYTKQVASWESLFILQSLFSK